MQRKDEVFDYINLVVGKAYSKNEALVTANVRPLNKKNNKEITGVTSFNNCIVLFCLLLWIKEVKKIVINIMIYFLIMERSFIGNHKIQIP